MGHSFSSNFKSPVFLNNFKNSKKGWLGLFIEPFLSLSLSEMSGAPGQRVIRPHVATLSVVLKGRHPGRP